MKKLLSLAAFVMIGSAVLAQSAQEKPVFKAKPVKNTEAAAKLRVNPTGDKAATTQPSKVTVKGAEAKQASASEIRQEMRDNVNNPNYDQQAAQRRLKAATAREQK